MKYNDFIWKDQIINGELVKTVRVRIREVPNVPETSIHVEGCYIGISDGETSSKKSRLFRNFTIVIKLAYLPRTIGNYKAKNKNNYLRLYAYIVPEEFKMKTLEELQPEFVGMHAEKYQYIKSALEQFYESYHQM